MKYFLDTNIIIPSRSLNEYAKIIEDTAEPVDVCVSPNKVLYIERKQVFGKIFL